MELLDCISAFYGGNVQFLPPYEGRRPVGLPAELFDILQRGDGVMETMIHPQTGKVIPISWIIYPCSMIAEETAFYRKTRSAEGTVFSSDGAGNPFLLKRNGTVVRFDVIDGTEVPAGRSLSDFYRIPMEGIVQGKP
jgi:hypothetical protein